MTIMKRPTMNALKFLNLSIMKGIILIMRTLTDEQSLNLAKLLIMMEVPKRERLEILSAIEIQEELLLLLDKLSERNYEMTPEEVYQASGEAVIELFHL